MIEKEYKTKKGNIHYWINNNISNKPTMVLLPGLTADHNLFKYQIDFFIDSYNILVWDPPGHGRSRPFLLNFSLRDGAKWLNEILLEEKIKDIILVGQSLGGYLSQYFINLYPDRVKAFISIDSGPLNGNYVSFLDIWVLDKIEYMFKFYSWNTLIDIVSKLCAETKQGRRLMAEMIKVYSKKEYMNLSSFGYKILASALEENLSFKINCPIFLICGEKDKLTSIKNYNIRWSISEKISLKFIKGAGHNSNTDKPESVNFFIKEFFIKNLI